MVRITSRINLYFWLLELLLEKRGRLYDGLLPSKHIELYCYKKTYR